MKSAIRFTFLLASIGVFHLCLSHAERHTSSDVMIFQKFDNEWYEGFYLPLRVSPDGRWALVGNTTNSLHLYSLPSGVENRALLADNLTGLRKAVYCGHGSPSLARFGSRGSKEGWFLPGHDDSQPSTDLTISSRVVACSPDGSEIAFSDPSASDHRLFVGKVEHYRSYAINGTLTAATFSSDGARLYYLVYGEDGESSLIATRVATGESQTVASHLDASLIDASIALSADDKYAYLALASDGVPDNNLRHKPNNIDRWLKIYRMDIATGTLHLVIDSPGRDNTAPAVANGRLYWIRSLIQESIVTFPVSGAPVKEVIAGGELPMWHPSGLRLGYFFGGIRLADQPLNLDGAAVSIDAEGNRTSKPELTISGYHEDFSPAWSPDGKWIAFHSHRSATPVPTYSSRGSTDDVYLRRSDDLHAPEIRLTDFGWETGPAYWSPDGHKLLFCSYKRGGVPGINKLFVITVDVQKGGALKTEMLPLSDDIRNVRWGAWSPDGQEIALEDDRGEGRRALWIVRADGSHPEKLLDYVGTSYDGLDWTRDGNSIVYSGLATAGTMQIFSIPRSGGETHQLTHDSGNLFHPRVSPDGRRIACTRIVQAKQLWYRGVSN